MNHRWVFIAAFVTNTFVVFMDLAESGSGYRTEIAPGYEMHAFFASVTGVVWVGYECFFHKKDG